MPPEFQQDITALLHAWNNGDEEALGDLIPVVYPEIRRIARQHLRRHLPGHSLESAALANEVYLKLVHSEAIHCNNRAHFFALCAQMIRHVLVDYARKQRYAKRGGCLMRIPLEDVLQEARARGVEILALDEALTALSKIDQRKVRVVELRYFGGLSGQETAEALEISEETVLRDWKMARAWLFGELTKK
jgi:RNA polymerase sigma-70 factor, ECF subfamily